MRKLGHFIAKVNHSPRKIKPRRRKRGNGAKMSQREECITARVDIKEENEAGRRRIASMM